MTRPFTAVASRLQYLGFDDAVVERTLAPARDLLEGPPRILFMGGFNAGKSSVINALVGAPVAPVGATPVTALVTHVRYGDAHSVCSVARDGARSWLEPEAYARLVDQSATAPDAVARRAAISHVEVFYPAEVLRNATLVDSPGLGSFDPRDDETTLAHLGTADAVCWVFDIEPGPQGPLVETIRRLAPQIPLAWGVLNKADLKTPAERLDVHESFDRTVGRHFRRLKLYSAAQAAAIAAGRPVHRDDAAGVRLDVVDQILDVLGGGPRRVSEATRAEAIGMAREAACRLVAEEWREVAANIAVVETFGTAGISHPALEVYDREIGTITGDTRQPAGERRYLEARQRVIALVEAAPPPVVVEGWVPAGLLHLSLAMHLGNASRPSQILDNVIPPSVWGFTSDIPLRARNALKKALETTRWTDAARHRLDGLTTAMRALHALKSTD